MYRRHHSAFRQVLSADLYSEDGSWADAVLMANDALGQDAYQAALSGAAYYNRRSRESNAYTVKKILFQKLHPERYEIYAIIAESTCPNTVGVNLAQCPLSGRGKGKKCDFSVSYTGDMSNPQIGPATRSYCVNAY